jgi:hypothetical protein
MEKKYGRIIELFDQFKMNLNDNIHENKSKVDEKLKLKNHKINKLLNNSNNNTQLNGIFGVLPLIDRHIHDNENGHENNNENENEKYEENENENSRLLPPKIIRKNGIFAGLENA